MKRVGRLAAIAVALVCVAAGSAIAQVMQHVPSESLVVAKINNLKAFSDKIAALAQQMGVAQFLPPLADPLGSLEREMKITNGINNNGDAAFALLDPDKYGGMEKRPGVLLLPVTDYKTFLTNFSRPTAATDKAAPDNAAPTTQAPPVPDAQGIATIAFPNEFDTAYITQWGDYAAISQNRAAIATKGAGMTVPGVAGKEMDSKDFIVYANMPALKVKVLPELKANRSKFTEEFDRALARNPHGTAMMPMFRIFLNQAIDSAQRLIEDSQAATYGISLEKTGIRTTVIAEFIPDSPTGKSISQIKNNDQTLLTGLPQAKYLVYGGLALDPQSAAEIFDQITGPARTELVQQGDSMKPLVQLLDLYKQMISSTEGQAFGWVAPTGPIGQSGIMKILGVFTGDTKTMLAAQKKAIELQPEIAKLSTGSGVKTTSTYTPNVKQIDGISFDQNTVHVEVTGPQTPQQLQASRMMKIMYGPNGVIGLVGTIDSKHAVYGIGVSDDLLTKAIEAVKTHSDPMGTQAELKDVQANLPKERIAVFYIPLDQIAASGAEYARQFGMPLNLQLPPGLPPIGVTAGTEQSAVRLDSFVPSQLVQSLVAAGMQAYMGMQGGGGGM